MIQFFKTVFVSLAIVLMVIDVQAVSVEKRNKPIIVSPSNARFEIVLDSNRTTGYSWHILEYDPAMLELKKQTFQQASSKHLGSSGKEHWFFKVKPLAFKAPHRLSLKFAYLRPWEGLKDAHRVEMFEVITASRV